MVLKAKITILLSILFLVMRNLNPPSSNWEVEKLSCDLKIHGLEQELELMRKECNDLKVELQKAKQTVLQHCYIGNFVHFMYHI